MKCAVVSKGLPTTNIRTTNLERERAKAQWAHQVRLFRKQSQQQQQLQNYLPGLLTCFLFRAQNKMEI